MQFTTIHGIGSAEQAETVWLHGYNNTGAEVLRGTPVAWDNTTPLDCRAFIAPLTAAVRLIAGIAQDTVGTAEYTSSIVAYGPVLARTYGVATTFVPGANLIQVTAKTYLVYGSEMLIHNQPEVFTALTTNATVDTVEQSVFVRAL